MKKTYISPSSLTVALNLRSHLLVDSAGSSSVTTDPGEEIGDDTNFARENKSVWDEEW